MLPTALIFQQLGLSLLLGLLVGLQRERTETGMPGLRTFPLITVLGTVLALMLYLSVMVAWRWHIASAWRRRGQRRLAKT